MAMRLVVVAALAATIGLGAGFGLGRPAQIDAQAGAPAIVGTFFIRTSADPTLPPSYATATFMRDGNIVAVSASPLQSPGLGWWTQTGPNEFSLYTEWFRWSPSGELLGVIRHWASVTADEQGYRGTNWSELRDPDGNLIAQNGTTTTAERIRGATGGPPIPGLPPAGARVD
ncbi:MAG: hypothetical protein KatS3mg060_0204 [Dehalococcoidia bacterium]|nr:MAG: hypothetical protein KatS3mg060_0204 [Dehalococcoidia bacterium]